MQDRVVGAEEEGRTVRSQEARDQADQILFIYPEAMTLDSWSAS